MNRWVQGILLGGAVAAVGAVIWRFIPHNKSFSKRRTLRKFINNFANLLINVLGKLGAFKLISRTRFMKNMVS